VIIPVEQLSDEALDGLIKEFCLRDWGLNETEQPLAEREHYVKRALEKGELVVLFSELHESAQLVSRQSIEMAASSEDPSIDRGSEFSQ
jgi:hypothetical protein